MSRVLLLLMIAANVVAFLGLSHGELSGLGAWSYVVAAWWLLTAGVLLWAAHARDGGGRGRDEDRTQAYSVRATDPQLWVVGVILILAFIFRSAELDRLPWGYAGIHLDAAYNSDVAFRILDGTQPFGAVLRSRAYARDCLTHYYLAAFYGLLGRRIETLRLACNILGLFNCLLLFLVMRNYTPSAFATAATLAAYAFSAPETVFALSGMEYIMATPFLLGSFVLFSRAMRRGKLLDAVLAGFTWGLGFSSHYSYVYLGLVLPAIAAVNLRTVRPWLPTFLLAGFLGLLPKLSYLIFNHSEYFLRFHQVARHDSAGGFLVPGYFSASTASLERLLFTTQVHFKSLLPEDPIIPPWQLPLIVVGLTVAVLRPRRPEHVLALLVSALTVAVNLAAYVMDYRVMNAMPIIFLLFGMGLATVEKAMEGRAVRALLTILIGGGLVHSVAAYFSHDDNAPLRDLYATQEVALARSIKKLRPPGMAYVLAPRTTYRLTFFNPDNPSIEQPNATLNYEAQQRFSRQALTTVMGNVERVLAREAARRMPVNFIISPASPYGDTVRQFLMSAPGARIGSWEVGDPVSHETTAYYLVSVQNAAQAMENSRNETVTFRRKPADDAQLRRGTLRLTTFAGTEQVLAVDEREVPAVLDFDFQNSVPYSGEWRSDFSLRWTGYMWAEQTSEYRFDATFDDGCRVFLDDHLLFADWAPGSARKATATMNLEAGWHPIRIDYFQVVNEARFLFEVRREGEGMAPLAAGAFASDCGTGTRSETQQRASEAH